MCHKDVFTSVRTITSIPVVVSLDNETSTWYCCDTKHDEPQGDPIPGWSRYPTPCSWLSTPRAPDH